MTPEFEILFIFEVLSTFIFLYGVITETKLQRGHTVASTAVIFRHRLDVDSSDPLLLFHSNQSKMLSTNDVKSLLKDVRRINHILASLKQRIYNPKQTGYHRYGGRGIKLCEEWHDPEKFLEWALNNGYAKGLQIDRIDNNGDYEPSNCRWVTPMQNTWNRNLRDDVGIYCKKNGFYVQIIRYNIHYCGGYSTDINEVRKFRDDLLKKLEEGPINPLTIVSANRKRQDRTTGRFSKNVKRTQ